MGPYYEVDPAFYAEYRFMTNLDLRFFNVMRLTVLWWSENTGDNSLVVKNFRIASQPNPDNIREEEGEGCSLWRKRDLSDVPERARMLDEFWDKYKEIRIKNGVLYVWEENKK